MELLPTVKFMPTAYSKLSLSSVRQWQDDKTFAHSQHAADNMAVMAEMQHQCIVKMPTNLNSQGTQKYRMGQGMTKTRNYTPTAKQGQISLHVMPLHGSLGVLIQVCLLLKIKQSEQIHMYIYAHMHACTHTHTHTHMNTHRDINYRGAFHV